MDTKEKIAVMQAWLDGKIIEWRYRHPAGASARWTAESRRPGGPELSWDWFNVDYRVKPEPFEAWVVLYDDNSVLICSTQQEAARISAKSTFGARAVKLREVPEE